MVGSATVLKMQSGLYCDALGKRRDMKRQNTYRDAAAMRNEGNALGIANASITEVSASSMLTRHQCVALCSDLLDGFSTSSFQQKIQIALKTPPAERFVPARMEVALEVQQQVLPKYGFQGSFLGVVKMMEAIAPYLGSSIIPDLVKEVEETLGLPMNSLAPYLGNYTVLDLVNEMDEKLGLPKNSTADVASWQGTFIPQEVSGPSRYLILSLCAELLDSFSASNFQTELRLLMESAGRQRFVSGRVSACLRIQEKILPKYGIPGNELGVTQMMALIAPFISDWWLRDLIEAIDAKLGLPIGTTASACYTTF